MTSRLIHPRMMKVLEKDFFSQLCTIERNTPVRDTAGQPAEHWDAVTGLTGLACRVGGISGGERRTNNQVYLDATNIILISGHYPGIVEKDHAVVDGIAYDIQLAQVSQEEALTRLVTRIVR